MGLSRWAIIRRHIIPNTLGPVIVYTTLTIPSVMLLEAFLSFLGLGIQPPQSSWGLLINYGVETMEEYPWLLFSRRRPLPNPVRPKLPRRWPARCPRSQSIEGLTLWHF